LGVVVLTPTNTTPFTRGSWSGSVTISNGANLHVRLTVTDTNGHSSQSSPFTVYATAAQTARIVSVGIVGGDVQIQFTTLAGRHYRLETADTPAGPWNIAVPDIVGTGATMTATNVGGSASLNRFYRMALQAGP
jgi:hypothetical protein